MEKEKFRFYFLWISAICITAFIIQVVFPVFTELFLLNKKSIDNFEIYRFITAIFLHGSLIHLMLNLFALLFFGAILEKKIGSKKFILIYFFSGIFANLISVFFYKASLGASGAIYGILGALIVIEPFMMVFSFGIMMPMFLAGFLWIIANILEGIGVIGNTNTENIAHLSGIAIGIILSFLILKKNFKNSFKKNQNILSEEEFQKWENKYLN